MAIDSVIKYWTIYKITNPVGQIYIGKTRSLTNRVRQYKYGAHPHHYLIYNSIKDYGFNAHSFQIIDEFESTEEYAEGKEMFWIRSNMSNRIKWPELNGLNMTQGGYGTIGKPTTNKQKTMASITHIGNKWRLGKKESNEHKIERIKKLKGQKRSEEQIKRLTESNIRLRGKAILQYDVDGEFIKEYATIAIAVKETCISRAGIRLVLRGKQKNIKGYIFKYK